MSTRAISQPLTLPSGQVLKNRLAKAAMSEQLADPSGRPTGRLIRLYERWAEGGAGLLITGNVMIDRTALGEPGNVVLESGGDLDPFQRWAGAVRRSGAALWMQLNHPGRQSPRIVSGQPVAPSAVPLDLGRMFIPPRALTSREVVDLIDRFATAASLAERAGFAGVQIHGAHGYLVSQFLSPLTNRRTDEWGGSLEGRTRFLLEIVRAIRARTSPSFGLGVKLNSADFQRGGFDEGDSIRVVEALNPEGVDLLEISGGTYERAAMWNEGTPSRPSTRSREAYFLDYAERVRDTAAMPVMLTGGFRTTMAMEQALSSGAVDLVGLARPLAVEPDLPARLLAGAPAAVETSPPRSSIGPLDKMATGLWYQYQIQRLADGKEPSPGAGWWALSRLLWFTVRHSRRVRTHAR